MTPREFIETAPLYTRIAISNFEPPISIMRMCTYKDCKKETTWKAAGNYNAAFGHAGTTAGIRGISYSCGLCGSQGLAVIYQMLDWEEHPGIGGMTPPIQIYRAVRKVGQIPAQEIDISPELSERLGDTAAHYKKALVCHSQNYGIGAMAYMRRVVDEKTEELIDVMIELSEAAGLDKAAIAKLQGAKTEVRYEDKLRVASDLIPEAVRPGGINPLGQLYKHTSIGLHGESDDECISIFDDLKADFEFVFRHLHLQAEEQRQYTKRIQERATKPTKS